MQLIY